MVHFTETCDAGTPHLVVHADTTPANVHEAMRTEPIHAALAAKNLPPAEHLVDAAYVSADHLVAAQGRYGIDLVGPARRNLSWQSRAGEAFGSADFAVDLDRQVVRCPQGKETVAGSLQQPWQGRRPPARAGEFRSTDCRTCPSRDRCTRSSASGRSVLVHPRARARRTRGRTGPESTDAYHRLYAQRQGIEGTCRKPCEPLACARHATAAWPRQALQTVATAAAINLDRLAAWFANRPLAATRMSRFAELAA